MLQAHLDAALSAGLTPKEAEEAWDAHCKGSDAKGFMRGGRAWVSFVAIKAKELTEGGTLTEATRELLRKAEMERANARREREHAELLYRQQAVTLPQWLATLRTRAAAGERLPAHEQVLLDYPMLDGDDPGAWLIDALSPTRYRRVEPESGEVPF